MPKARNRPDILLQKSRKGGFATPTLEPGAHYFLFS